MAQLLADIGTEHRSTAPYKPSTNGAGERFIRAVKQSLAFYHEHGKKNNWATYLFEVTSNYNKFPQSSLGCTPYEALFGCPPTPRIYRMKIPLPELTEKIIERATKDLPKLFDDTRPHPATNVRDKTERKTITAAEKMLTRENAKSNRKEPPFKIGDFVYVKDHTKPVGFQKHLSLNNDGPYEILDKLPDKNTYKIKFPMGSTKREWVSGEDLKVANERPPGLVPTADKQQSRGDQPISNRPIEHGRVQPQVEPRRGVPPSRLALAAFNMEKARRTLANCRQ